MPEWLLQLLMPVAASQLMRKVYHPHTFQTQPQLIRSEWLGLVAVKPWVMQAQCPQVRAAICWSVSAVTLPGYSRGRV